MKNQNVNKKHNTSAKKRPSKSLKESAPLQAKDNQDKIKIKSTFPIVGMGASAGGLEAFEQFFIHMPTDSGIAFVVVPHLDPSHASMLTDLLKRFTKMKVIEIKDRMRVEPDHVYVIPPNKDIAIFHGILQLTMPAKPRGLRMPIDLFFRSLAEDQGERTICIILSGSGSDGTMGLRAINGAGGMSIVQEPASAKYDSMPKSAINTGLVDYVLPVEKMPAQLLGYMKHSFLKKAIKISTSTTLEKSPKSFEKILMLLRSNTGHDFSFYKKSTIYRRIERRMSLHEIEDTSKYLRYLQEYPDEIQMLFKEFLISVTSFFRDPEAFEVLKTKALPKMLENKPENYSLRVWVPGCASGEEAYSIAMAFRESADKLKRDFKFQIFGTDIDEDAISTARAGIYPSNISIDMTPERLKGFFVKEDNAYRVKKEIRETVVFAVQNVIKDPPFTKLDILSCRNLLIYLDSELQNKLLPLFHYSLKPGGILFLGSSESIGRFVDIFNVIDKKWRFFQSKESIFSAQTMTFTGLPWTYEPSPWEGAREVKKIREINVTELTQKLLLENFSPPCVIINEKGEILYVQGRTGKYLETAPGQASLNILEMAREGLIYELRAAIRNAISKKKDIIYRGLQVKTDGGFQTINLTVKPIDETEGMQGLMMVVFEDISPVTKAESEKTKVGSARKHNKRVEELEMELNYTRESLQAMIEELQSSNEELKSTNEELQSTNEELQSTNEEMESCGEEMQSVNEELMMVNSELQASIDQLARAENDMKNLIGSSKIGIIFLDNKLCIKRFTPEATKVINLISTDVGRPVGHMVSNLKYENLLIDAQKVIDSLVFTEVEVQTKEGNWYLMRIMPYRTVDNVLDGVVITFNDITQLKRTEEELIKLNAAFQAARKYAESIVETVREALVVLNAGLHVISVNQSFYKIFKVTKEETEGRFIYELGNRQWDIPSLRELLEEILPKNTYFEDFEVIIDFPGIGKRTMLLNARRIFHEGIGLQMILLAIEDVTEKILRNRD